MTTDPAAPPFRIRPALAEDSPALAEIFRTSRRDAFHWSETEDFFLSDFTEQTRGEIVHLAEDVQTGCPLGFIAIWEPDRFIHHLFIHPDHQGRGIGNALLKSLHSCLPFPHRLKCLLANRRALDFYDSRGWIEISQSSDSSGPYALLEYGGQISAPAIGEREKILFVCARNKIRSLTAECLFEKSSHYEVRSRGLSSQSRIRVTATDLAWADRVFVMEKEQKSRIAAEFREQLGDLEIVCLFIEDIYQPMEPALIEILEERLRDHLIFP